MHMPNRYANRTSNFEFIKSILFDTDILTTGIRINIAAILLVVMLLLSNYWWKKDEEMSKPKSVNQSMPKPVLTTSSGSRDLSANRQ